jgi:hypothetical protein
VKLDDSRVAEFKIDFDDAANDLIFIFILGGATDITVAESLI